MDGGLSVVRCGTVLELDRRSMPEHATSVPKQLQHVERKIKRKRERDDDLFISNH
jgi:hypothetical protein